VRPPRAIGFPAAGIAQSSSTARSPKDAAMARCGVKSRSAAASA